MSREEIIQETINLNDDITSNCVSHSMNLQSSPAISNSEGTGKKVGDSAIFEIARLRDSEITPGEN